MNATPSEIWGIHQLNACKFPRSSHNSHLAAISVKSHISKPLESIQAPPDRRTPVHRHPQTKSALKVSLRNSETTSLLPASTMLTALSALLQLQSIQLTHPLIHLQSLLNLIAWPPAKMIVPLSLCNSTVSNLKSSLTRRSHRPTSSLAWGCSPVWLS